jgi:DNA-binding transcriptional ArsR family regulator
MTAANSLASRFCPSLAGAQCQHAARDPAGDEHPGKRPVDHVRKGIVGRGGQSERRDRHQRSAHGTGARDTAVSQQRALLRRDGLVASRREGQMIYYSLANDEASRLLEVLQAIFCPASDAD